MTEDLSEVAQLEDKLIQHLTQPASITENKDILRMSNNDVDGMVVDLMTKKVNQKFETSLNPTQKKLLQLYVFSAESSEAKSSLLENLETLRKRVSTNIEKALAKDGEAQKVGHKLKEVQSLLQEDFRDITHPDDRLVTFYMTVSKLDEELTNE